MSNTPFNTTGGIHEIPVADLGATGRLFLCGKHHIGPNAETVRGACGGARALTSVTH